MFFRNMLYFLFEYSVNTDESIKSRICYVSFNETAALLYIILKIGVSDKNTEHVFFI